MNITRESFKAKSFRQSVESRQSSAPTGDKEKAFAWLEKSYQMHQVDLISIKIDPTLEDLRGEPRFTDLRRRHLNLDDLGLQ